MTGSPVTVSSIISAIPIIQPPPLFPVGQDFPAELPDFLAGCEKLF
jgi:hypothetical protein